MDRNTSSIQEDVEMKPEAPKQATRNEAVDEKRHREELRLHEMLQIVNCTESAYNFGTYFVIPIFLSIRTSGPDRHKHGVLQIAYMMASPLEKLETQPARTINVEFDPSKHEADPDHLRRFGLDIKDFVRSEAKNRDLSTIKEAIDELFDVLTVLCQEQIDKAKRLMRAAEVKPKVMFFIYNDLDALQFFYHWYLPRYRFTYANLPNGDTLYNISGDGLLDMERNNYPLKIESKYDINDLKTKEKIKAYYNLLTDLPFPEPIGQLANGDPLYSIADEFHILLVVYCTLRIPDWYIAQSICATTIARSDRTRDVVDEAEDKMRSIEYGFWPTTNGDWFIPNRLIEEARQRVADKMKRVKPRDANAAG